MSISSPIITNNQYQGLIQPFGQILYQNIRIQYEIELLNLQVMDFFKWKELVRLTSMPSEEAETPMCQLYPSITLFTHPTASIYIAHYNNGYTTYGRLQYNGGYLPRSYGTYRLSYPVPVAGTFVNTYGITYRPTYGNSLRTGRCSGLMFPLC